MTILNLITLLLTRSGFPHFLFLCLFLLAIADVTFDEPVADGAPGLIEELGHPCRVAVRELVDAREVASDVIAKRNDLVGVVGTAITDLRPSGTGLFGDERIDVVSESEWIAEGTSIKVISAEGYRHIVRAVAQVPEETAEQA